MGKCTVNDKMVISNCLVWYFTFIARNHLSNDCHLMIVIGWWDMDSNAYVCNNLYLISHVRIQVVYLSCVFPMVMCCRRETSCDITVTANELTGPSKSKLNSGPREKQQRFQRFVWHPTSRMHPTTPNMNQNLNHFSYWWRMLPIPPTTNPQDQHPMAEHDNKNKHRRETVKQY